MVAFQFSLFYGAAFLWYVVVGLVMAVLVWVIRLFKRIRKPVLIWLWATTVVSFVSFLIVFGVVVYSYLNYLS